MAGIVELDELLKSMSPQLQDGEYVFCTVDAGFDYRAMNPLAMFVESEGVTLILSVEAAHHAGFTVEGIFRQITLTVHSSLDAVGLTAAVATRLASRNISANVVAAYFHDHIFVQAARADEAVLALQEFASTELQAGQ